MPGFAARFHAGRRETRFVGMSVANFLRTPYGPGWALVGDAGYTKDFITGLGISDGGTSIFDVGGFVLDVGGGGDCGGGGGCDCG